MLGGAGQGTEASLAMLGHAGRGGAGQGGGGVRLGGAGRGGRGWAGHGSTLKYVEVR